MDFLEEMGYYYTIYFKSYFNFKGRAGRREFWLLMFFNIFCVFIPFVQLITFIPSLALTFRRSHDRNRSYLPLFLLQFLPVSACLFTLISCFQEFVEALRQGVFLGSPSMLFEEVILYISGIVSFVIIVYVLTIFCQKGDQHGNHFGFSPDLIDDVVKDLHAFKKHTLLLLSGQGSVNFSMRMKTLHQAFVKLRTESDPVSQGTTLKELASEILKIEEDLTHGGPEMKNALERIAIIKEKFSRI